MVAGAPGWVVKILVLPPGIVEPTYWAIASKAEAHLWCAPELAERAAALFPDAEVMRLPGGPGSAARWLAAQGRLDSAADADLDALAEQVYGVQR